MAALAIAKIPLIVICSEHVKSFETRPCEK